MAKNIWIYSRKKNIKSVEGIILSICEKIAPDNIIPNKPKVVVNDHVAFGIMNPTNTLLISGNSILIGKTFGDNINWETPNNKFPDGSYALFRDGKELCEIVSDPSASRTIWYYMNDEILIASTSQRAIILFIGEFQFNEKVIPWMLSTGSLGPDYSWDKRIKRIGPDSSIILNKNNWTLSSKSNPIEFHYSKETDQKHEKNLRSAINSTFQSIKLNFKDWILPLSGGYDSRGILCFINSTDSRNVKTITWGLKSALNETGNDASVAKDLSRALKVPNKYYHTNLSKEPEEEIFNRFLLNGEGRIDQVSGYMDGFKIWKNLFEDNIHGIIRGDEGFGWGKVSSKLDVRMITGLGLCSDYFNLTPFSNEDVFKQEIPEKLLQRDDESLSKWRDRLYHQYRFPTILAALSDLKLSYIELVNPLLSKNILEEVRKLPDHLRTEKNLFKKIVNSVSPQIAYAKEGATQSPSAIFKQKGIVNILGKELSSDLAHELFPEEFLSHVLEKINKVNTNDINKTKSFSIKALIKKNTPGNLKATIRNLIRNRMPSSNTIDYNTLAFRIYIIVKMKQILESKT
ncbi:hypothetical protein [Algibacter mikhailovii]|uniref:hypothetical protein n=1 Tax=Algibacter mikhailovii TaxID=425498 RepID=UPI002495A2DE|nr:hypothetical protein [Algibacter mikhailovii]